MFDVTINSKRGFIKYILAKLPKWPNFCCKCKSELLSFRYLAELGQLDIFVVKAFSLSYKCVLCRLQFCPNYAQKLIEIDHFNSNMQKCVHFSDLACILY